MTVKKFFLSVEDYKEKCTHYHPEVAMVTSLGSTLPVVSLHRWMCAFIHVHVDRIT